MDDTNAIVRHIKRSALEVCGDNGRWKCGFKIAGSTGTVHKVSFDSAPGAGYWTCSCRGNIRWGQCKHLTAMGLTGRKSGRSLKWVQHFRLG